MGKNRNILGSAAFVVCFALGMSGCLQLQPMGKVIEKNPLGTSSLLTDASPSPSPSPSPSVSPSPGASPSPAASPSPSPSPSPSVNFVADSVTQNLSAAVVNATDFSVYPQGQVGYSAFGGSFRELLNASLSCFKFIGKTLVACTHRGLTLSNDFGRTWVTRTMRNGLSDHYVSDALQAGENLWVITNFGLHTSTDGGANFKFVQSIEVEGGDKVNTQLSRLIKFEGNRLFIAAGSGLFYSDNLGLSWKKAVSAVLGDLQKLTTSGENLVGLDQNGIVVSKDRGMTWRRTLTAVSNANAQLEVSGSRVIASSEPGGNTKVYISGDSAETFSEVPSMIGGQSTTEINSTVSAFGSSLYLTNPGSTVVFVSADGRTMTARSISLALKTGLTVSGHLKAAQSGTDVVAMTDGGFHRSSNSGTSFALTGTQDTPKELMVYREFHYLSGSAGRLLATTRGQFDELLIITGNGTAVKALHVSDALGNLAQLRTAVQIGTKIYLATSQGLKVTSDDGETWTTIGTAQGLPSADVYCANAYENYVWACTARGFAISTDGGRTFAAKPTASGNVAINVVNRFLALLSTPHYYYLAAGKNVFASSDGGASFSRLPTFSTSGEVRSVFFDSVRQRLWALTSTSLQYSADYGNTWVTPTSSNGSVSGAFSRGQHGFTLDGSRIYIGATGGVSGEKGGVLTSADGNSFTLLQSGLDMPQVHDLNLIAGQLLIGTNGGLYLKVR